MKPCLIATLTALGLVVAACSSDGDAPRPAMPQSSPASPSPSTDPASACRTFDGEPTDAQIADCASAGVALPHIAAERQQTLPHVTEGRICGGGIGKPARTADERTQLRCVSDGTTTRWIRTTG